MSALNDRERILFREMAEFVAGIARRESWDAMTPIALCARYNELALCSPRRPQSQRKAEMGTKNCPGDFDCYTNAADDEPMFILLARDESAPELVREWVDRRHFRKQEEAGDLGLQYDAKALEALRCADAMEAWRSDPALAQETPEETRSL